MQNKLFHRATAIGSLPHHSIADAMGLIKENLVNIPHWPQLPRMNPREGMIRQNISPLVKEGLVTFPEDGMDKPYFCTDDPEWDALVLSYFEKLLDTGEDGGEPSSEDQSMFAFPSDTAEGFYAFLRENWSATEVDIIKGQISGPLVVGLQVTSPDGNLAFYDDQLREILVKTLASQARWQVQQLKAFDRPVLVFIDDPAIYGYGTSSYVGLGRESITESLYEMVSGIKNEGGLSGVHCCAGVDWSLIFGLPVDVVDFDAYSYFSSMLVYVDNLTDFLDRGGILAWGIVPTSSDIENEDAETLYSKLQEGIDVLVDYGVNRKQLEEQMMITPSCGAATLNEAQATKVYNVLRELEKKISGK